MVLELFEAFPGGIWGFIIFVDCLFLAGVIGRAVILLYEPKDIRRNREMMEQIEFRDFMQSQKDRIVYIKDKDDIKK